MAVLYLLRHGETQWNVEQRMQGHGDSPLTERGREQAARHGEVLVREGVDRLLASPSGRTRETADIVSGRLAAAGLAPPVSFHEVLMERHSGEWEGLTLSDIRARYPRHWRERATDPWFHRPPGGENHADLELRVASLIAALRRRVGGAERPERFVDDACQDDGLPEPVAGERIPERVAVITHGIMSRVILKLLLDLDPAEAVTLRHPNALLYRLEFTPAGIRHGHFMDGAGPIEGLLRH